MKKILLLILSPMPLLAYTLLQEPTPEVVSSYEVPKVQQVVLKTSAQKESAEEGSWYRKGDLNAIVDYALSLQGSPYVYAGTSPDGFDCSGFITHVYDKFNVDLPHSSAMQSEEGIEVDRSEARPGDLVIFTGTDKSVREPGHVGIVISSPGDTVSFVHSSSNGGVKISKVEGTGYDQRFLEVRRVL
ncbi:C40 family peptidase [Pontibacter ruber]|uniref:C40 family peptidase n=1 Tax=Pontibacter ruber TaxID=1343895 RepID=A0ABW5CS13_9BACT|nr:C40 family peptidase [Pontibacter ruber]